MSWQTQPSLFPPGVEILNADHATGRLVRGAAGLGLAAFLRGVERLLPQTMSGYRPTTSTTLAALGLCLRRRRGGITIAVDAAAMLACQWAGRPAHFVSLEILHNDAYYLMLRRESILSVVTQNQLRCDLLFPDRDVRCFVVPNFPIFRERALPPKSQRFVWGGSAFPGFGIGAALDFLNRFPDESISIMGWVSGETQTLIDERYGQLLRDGRLTVTSEFQPDEEYIAALARHRFGFSFYNLELAADFFGGGRPIRPWGHPNYWTGFPGKIGMYMAAGVPVIGSDLPGMVFVEQHRVGVLVGDLSPDRIREAAGRIEANYESFRSNALGLARHFCFRGHLQPFLDEISRPSAESPPTRP